MKWILFITLLTPFMLAQGELLNLPQTCRELGYQILPIEGSIFEARILKNCAKSEYKIFQKDVEMDADLALEWCTGCVDQSLGYQELRITDPKEREFEKGLLKAKHNWNSYNNLMKKIAGTEMFLNLDKSADKFTCNINQAVRQNAGLNHCLQKHGPHASAVLSRITGKPQRAIHAGNLIDELIGMQEKTFTDWGLVQNKKPMEKAKSCLGPHQSLNYQEMYFMAEFEDNANGFRDKFLQKLPKIKEKFLKSKNLKSFIRSLVLVDKDVKFLFEGSKLLSSILADKEMGKLFFENIKPDQESLVEVLESDSLRDKIVEQLNQQCHKSLEGFTKSLHQAICREPVESGSLANFSNFRDVAEIKLDGESTEEDYRKISLYCEDVAKVKPEDYEERIFSLDHLNARIKDTQNEANANPQICQHVCKDDGKGPYRASGCELKGYPEIFADSNRVCDEAEVSKDPGQEDLCKRLIAFGYMRERDEEIQRQRKWRLGDYGPNGKMPTDDPRRYVRRDSAIRTFLRDKSGVGNASEVLTPEYAIKLDASKGKAIVDPTLADARGGGGAAPIEERDVPPPVNARADIAPQVQGENAAVNAGGGIFGRVGAKIKQKLGGGRVQPQPRYPGFFPSGRPYQPNQGSSAVSATVSTGSGDKVSHRIDELKKEIHNMRREGKLDELRRLEDELARVQKEQKSGQTGSQVDREAPGSRARAFVDRLGGRGAIGTTNGSRSRRTGASVAPASVGAISTPSGSATFIPAAKSQQAGAGVGSLEGRRAMTEKKAKDLAKNPVLLDTLEVEPKVAVIDVEKLLSEVDQLDVLKEGVPIKIVEKGNKDVFVILEPLYKDGKFSRFFNVKEENEKNAHLVKKIKETGYIRKRVEDLNKLLEQLQS